MKKKKITKKKYQRKGIRNQNSILDRIEEESRHYIYDNDMAYNFYINGHYITLTN